MGEAWQFDRFIHQLDTDQGAAFWQGEASDTVELIKWHMFMGFGRIGTGAGILRCNGKHETGAKGMGRAHQIADIEGLANTFHADAKIAAHDIRHFNPAMAVSLQAAGRQGKLSHCRLILVDKLGAIMAPKKNIDTAVRGQYEAYPYPPRDAADEATRLITGSPSSLVEIEHYVFGRKLAGDEPFRALIAGGGTGDATIMLASQLAARGLDSITFIQASLSDLAELKLVIFDYIDCCGVLHHLPDPAAALKSLVAALQPEGGIGLMLYGRLGRTGIYEAQDLLRLLADDVPDPARVDTARALLDDLPPTNWLLRNSHIGDHRNAGDAGIYDLLLHRQDRAYTVPEIFALATDANLDITDFIEPARYDPLNYLTDGALRDKAAALPWPDQCAAAELICGNMKVHICYLVHAGASRDIPLQPHAQTAIPMLNEASGAALPGQLKGAPAISLDIDGAKIRLFLPENAAEIAAQVNDERSLAEIRRRLGKAGLQLSPSAFSRQFTELYKALNGINAMFLR